MKSYNISIDNITYSLFDHAELPAPANSGNNREDFIIVLRSAGIKLIKDYINPNDIRGHAGRLWYELRKQPLYEEFDLQYLNIKLGMSEATAKEFIKKFNAYISRCKNGKA